MSPGCLVGGVLRVRAVGSGVESKHPLWFPCSVRKTNQVITLTSLPRGRHELPFREHWKLFTLGLQIFCLLTLVLFIVYDYGQLGCHFFQIPV